MGVMGGNGHGQRTGDRFDSAVQCQFSDKDTGGDGFLWQDTLSHQNADRNTQLKACPFLF